MVVGFKIHSLIPETNKTSFVSSFQPVSAAGHSNKVFLLRIGRNPWNERLPTSWGGFNRSPQLLLRLLNVRNPAEAESKFDLVIQPAGKNEAG